ncbi:DUF3857 domain-containing transglutaminase family protein [Nonlabens xiamenensis]|uniref:DUF3857 domain-containing transglutaminase family protein n=1 Tax=Nonlabens xiamenensis TaxID=2341043 RepID=UPI000F60996B|nr:DUF3857 domain-containing transglutaminase family protein [Nonlabens xiamenensis]
MRIQALSLFLVFCLCGVQAQVKTSQIPTWVTPTEYSQSPAIDKNELSQGTLQLLRDNQTHLVKETVYIRQVTQVIDNAAIQEAGTINVDYDPTFQELVFHEINILRNSSSIDKLQPNNFQLLRREANAENYLYDGSMTAMVNLSDVRPGDIIDYSYSIKGFNPIHKGLFSNSYTFDGYSPVGKINVRLLSNKPLKYKGFNGLEKPFLNKINGLNEYTWTSTDVTPLTYEEYDPAWNINYKLLLVSAYDSWASVVNWAVNVYQENQPLSDDLSSHIEQIASATEDEGERIQKVLDFVQEDIRYLGLEEGIGGYQPFSPNQVYEQRFGDCKDKSLLMASMLKQLDIEAYPMLVNTTLKQSILDFLPSPIFFDHCVVKVIDNSGKVYYYDPTISSQGGSYAKTHFPDYRYGLVIKRGVREFDQISSRSENKVEVKDEYRLDSIGKGAILKVKSVYHDAKADQMRQYFKSQSLNAINKEYEKYYANYFYNIKSIEHPQLTDDVLANRLQVIEKYKIDSIWQPMEDKKNLIEVQFVPNSIDGLLFIPNVEHRKNPVSLDYPSHHIHDITVHLPAAWDIQSEIESVEHDSFDYQYRATYIPFVNQLKLHFEIKSKKDHITVEKFSDYSRKVNDLSNKLGYVIYTTSDGSSLTEFETGNGTLKIVGLIAVAALIIMILVVRSNQSARNDAYRRRGGFY